MHDGVKRTLYFVRLIDPRATKAEVQAVVRDCRECQSIDPAPIHWKLGRLDVAENWNSIAKDVTHFSQQLYLTLIDCGPSCFGIWKPLSHQDFADIINQLEVVFYEKGLRIKQLTDNDVVLCGQRFAEFAWTWVYMYYFGAPTSMIGIVERSHHTIKHIAERMQCSITEAVYWHNVMLKDDKTASTAPANATYSCKICLKGINMALVPDNEVSSRYMEADIVWVKDPYGRCMMQIGEGMIRRSNARSLLIKYCATHKRLVIGK